MKDVCQNCQAQVKQLNNVCQGCGFTLVIEPDQTRKEKFLRVPSLGALLFTQGWTFGARLYLLFVLSLIPIVGFLVLFVGVIFGRRLAWRYGSWKDWHEFETRMHLLDVIGVIWIGILVGIYFFLRK